MTATKRTGGARWVTVKVTSDTLARVRGLKEVLGRRGIDALLTNIGDPGLANELGRALFSTSPGNITISIGGIFAAAVQLLDAHTEPQDERGRRRIAAARRKL